MYLPWEFLSIWSPVYVGQLKIFVRRLKLFEILIVSETNFRFCISGTWSLIYEIVVESYVKQQINILYEFLYDEWNEPHNVVEGVQLIKLSPIAVKEESVNKWWPTGYGNQYLYTAKVSIICITL